MTDLYDDAIDALRELADALSDLAADHSADVGAIGHTTPKRIVRLYDLADRLAEDSRCDISY